MDSKLRERLLDAIAPFVTGAAYALIVKMEEQPNSSLVTFREYAPLSFYDLRRLRDVYEELLAQ